MKAHNDRPLSGRTGRLPIALLLLSLVLFPPLGQPAAPAAAAPPAEAPSAKAPAARANPTESWLITWNASTDGGGSGAYGTVSRQARVSATFVVNYYADGSSEYYVNQFTTTFVWDHVYEDSCGEEGGRYWKHRRKEVIDTSRYSGRGPVRPNTVMRVKPYLLITNIWELDTLNLWQGPTAKYELVEESYCGGGGYRSYEVVEDHEYMEPYWKYDLPGTIFSGGKGPLFEFHADKMVDPGDVVPYQLHVQEHVRVEMQTGLDLSVREVEVTQGLQLNNTIPLVQGRRTIVRAYIDIGADPGPIENVTGRVRAYNKGRLLGELWPFNMADSISAKRSPDWHNLDDTLNFELPFGWITYPDLWLDVEVNHTRQIGEKDYANNTLSVPLTLADCRPIRIGYLRIRYEPPGLPVTEPGADIARGQEFLRKVYPVADNELLYRPWPGIGWNQLIDSATITDTAANAEGPLELLLWTLRWTSGSGPVDRLVGWFAGSASTQLNGISNAIPGQVAWVAQKKNPNYWRATFAHEVGHTYGLYHNALTTGGYHWIDVYTREIKPPRPDGKLLDFIYTPGVPEAERWVSPASYMFLYNQFCSSGAAAQAGPSQATEDLLVVSGSVNLTATQAGELGPLYRVAAASLVPPAGSTYAVVLKNGATELARYGFDVDQEVESTVPITPTVAPFAFGLPYPAGVNRVDLLDAYNHVLSTRVASAHAPTVTVQFPNAAGLTLAGLQTIRWTGGDVDGDGLTYGVLYSADNGATWTAVGAGITGTSYEADFDTYPGSAAARIKVLVSDGFLTASDVSDQPFVVPSKPPVPGIIAPPAGAVFKVGEQIKLQGYAVDLEEGMVGDASLSWSSDRDGPLGSGGTLEVALSEGAHTITLAAAGSSETVTTTLVVQQPTRLRLKPSLYLPTVLRK